MPRDLRWFRGDSPMSRHPCASPICYRPARLGYVSVRNGAVVQAWLKRRSYGRIDAARAEVWGQAARSAIASMPGSRTGSGRNEPSSSAASTAAAIGGLTCGVACLHGAAA
jgi:hypothetical protein